MHRAITINSSKESRRRAHKVLVALILLILGCIDGGPTSPVGPSRIQVEEISLSVGPSLVTVGAKAAAKLLLPSGVFLEPGSVTWTVTPEKAAQVIAIPGRADSVQLALKEPGNLAIRATYWIRIGTGGAVIGGAASGQKTGSPQAAYARSADLFVAPFGVTGDSTTAKTDSTAAPGEPTSSLKERQVIGENKDSTIVGKDGFAALHASSGKACAGFNWSVEGNGSLKLVTKAKQSLSGLSSANDSPQRAASTDSPTIGFETTGYGVDTVVMAHKDCVGTCADTVIVIVKPIPSGLSLLSAPSQLTASSTATTPIAIQLTNQDGSASKVDKQSVTGRLVKGNGTLKNAKASTVAGIANFPQLSIDGAPGDYVIRFESEKVAKTADLNLTLLLGPPVRFNWITLFPEVWADGYELTPCPTLELADASGNAITREGVELRVRVGDQVLATVTTNAKGRASFCGLTLVRSMGAIDKDGTSTITVSVDATSLGISNAPSVKISGDKDKKPDEEEKKVRTLTVEALTIAAGTTQKLNAIVRDGPNLTLATSATAPGSFAFAIENTDIATVDAQGTVRGTKKGKTTVNVAALGVTGSASVTVVEGTLDAGKSSLQVAETSLRPNAKTTATVTLRDGEGNVVATATSAQFEASATGGTFGTWSCSGGVCTADYTASGTSGPYQLTANAGGKAVGGSPVTVRVIAGELDANRSEVGVATDKVPSGITTSLTVSPRDASGNLLYDGSLSVSATASGGESTVEIDRFVYQASDGTYRASVKGKRAGSATTFTATAGGKTLAQRPTLTVVSAGTPVAGQSKFAIDPTTVPAGGSTTVTVALRDADGNLIADVNSGMFRVDEPPGDGSLAGWSCSAGVCKATFTASKTPDQYQFNASITGQAISGSPSTLTVTPSTLDGARSEVTVRENGVRVGQATELLVTLRDVIGNLLSNGDLSLKAKTIDGSSQVEFGQFTYNPNDKTYRASVTGKKGGSAVKLVVSVSNETELAQQPALTVTTGAPSAKTSTLNVSEKTVVAGSAVTVTVAIRDADGNLDGSATSGSFTARVTKGKLGSWTCGGGTCTSVWSNLNKASVNEHQIEVTIDDTPVVGSTASVEVYKGPPSNAHDAKEVEKTDISIETKYIVGSTVSPEDLPNIEVTDVGGNPLTAVKVKFSLEKGDGFIEGYDVTTDEFGKAKLGSWKIGPRYGPNIVKAVAEGVQQKVEYTASAGYDVSCVLPPFVFPEEDGARKAQVEKGSVAPVKCRARDSEGTPVHDVEGTVSVFPLSSNVEVVGPAPFEKNEGLLIYNLDTSLQGFILGDTYKVVPTVVGAAGPVGNGYFTIKAQAPKKVIALTAITISGSPTVGQTLTAKVTPNGATASYKWQARGKKADDPFSDIGEGASYTLKAGDLGKVVRVIAVGTDAYSGSVEAITSDAIAAQPLSEIIIIGSLTVGQTLTATVAPREATASYQWHSSDAKNGPYAPIAGANSSTYTLSASDYNNYLKVVATAAEAAYTGSVEAATSGKIAAQPLGAIAISGSPMVGAQLTTTLQPSGASATYKWQSSATVDGHYSDIRGATNNSFTLTANEYQQYIRVVATGTGAYAGSVEATTSKVNPQPLTAIAMSGSPTVGQILSATLTPSGVTATYKWMLSVDGSTWTEVLGATSSTYRLTANEHNKFVKVVANATGAYTGAQEATTESKVAARPLSAVAISGSPMVGQALTATLTPSGASASYKWQSSATKDGVYTDIESATSSAYTLQVRDYKRYLKVVATAAAEADTGSVEAITSDAIAAQPLSAIAITGSLIVGEKLTAALTPSGANAKYEWQSSAAKNGPYATIMGAANTSAYTLQASDYDHYLRVVATAAEDAYTGSVEVTTGTKIAAQPLTEIIVIGNSTVGQTLTAGLKPGEATASYQWQSSATPDGRYSDIRGATSSTYTLTANELDRYVRVQATGSGAFSGSIVSTAVQVMKAP